MNYTLLRIYEKIYSKIFTLIERVTIICKIIFNNKKTIYLFGCPIHTNLGDQAQTYCTIKWLNDNYPDYKILMFSWNTSFNLVLKIVEIKIKKSDLIFGHSGYFFVDHHKELPVYQKLATIYTNNKIVILPQTINLKKHDVIDKVSEALNSHPNFTLLCRDEVSYLNAKKYFGNCKLILFPDIVTTMIGTKKYIKDRKGVLFCMRNDIEAHYSNIDINNLRNRFNGIAETKITDTSIKMPFYKLKNKREFFLNNIIDNFSNFKVIITDRYHGTIFSLIANTPVIVLASADHKLSSGVNWFPDSFKEYVHFANNLDEAYKIACNILQKENTNNTLPAYFKSNYYDNLKQKLS